MPTPKHRGHKPPRTCAPLHAPPDYCQLAKHFAVISRSLRSSHFSRTLFNTFRLPALITDRYLLTTSISTSSSSSSAPALSPPPPPSRPAEALLAALLGGLPPQAEKRAALVERQLLRLLLKEQV